MKPARFISEINFVRALACLAVLAVHVSAGVFYRQGYWDPVAAGMNQIGRFGTPVFAVISGFLLFNQVRVKGFSLPRFIRSRTTKIIVPYLVWSTIYLSILKFGYGIDHFVSFDHWLKTVLSGNVFYHLYFVMVVIQFYLVFPLLQRILRTRAAWWVGTAAALVVNAAVLMGDVTDLPGWIGKGFTFFSKASLPYWIFYFLFGGWLAFHWDGLAQWFQKKSAAVAAWIAGAVVTAGAVVEYQWLGMYGSSRLANLFNIPVLILTGSVLYASIRRAVRLREGLQTIGSLGFGIYLVHPLVILCLVQVLPASMWRPHFLPVLFLLVLLLTVGAVKAIQRLPFHQYLLTVPSRNTGYTAGKRGTELR
ncbi:surface polysaccharide O-acyltransferase-like enzyme [Melghirimyces profundicolus]|uniref:Surface polysaccharide O-acyltransferase-like enzyme n=1 Tax=Melghirimyces profundicolus TaxID=1242148 RepID=A0A2T6BSX3_9BACL|nr:acyltransferase [Melghirimyces profundicolus]PTX59057.1 surface polysaccharide O-acyltransferase-like enzyme [Melghirimyces profundicolus]